MSNGPRPVQARSPSASRAARGRFINPKLKAGRIPFTRDRAA